MEQTRNKTKKTESLSVHNYSPPQSQYFVEPPLAANTTASLLGYIFISLAHLATGIFSILQGKTAPDDPSSWMSATGVQQSLSHTADTQFD